MLAAALPARAWLRALAVLLAALTLSATPAAAQDAPPAPPDATATDDEGDGDGDDVAPVESGWWEDDEEAWAPVPEPAPEAEPEWPEEDPAAPPPPPAPLLPTIPVPTTRTIPGKIAYVRADGRAAIPRRAPKRVKRVIAAANEIVGKPYKWGGGHARLLDKGYDCSGTVGYALIRAGLLTTPMVSGQFARWGAKNEGRHITIYANAGHVYMEVAGLRLDTSPVSDPSGKTGPRWRATIGRRPRFKVRHPIGL
ncbi:MAG TPA: hypothetical protein VF533_20590 [Solirubrobacteraceae bacterium]